MPCIQTPLRSLQISSTSPALRTTAESPLSAAAPRVSCPHTRGHRTNTKRAQLRSRRRAARSPSAHLQAALCLPDPLLTPSRSPAQHAPPATATSVPLPPRGVSRPGRPNREPAAPGAARPPLQHRRRPPSVIRREGRRGRTGGAALPWGSLLQPEVPADAAAPEVLPGRPNRVPPPPPPRHGGPVPHSPARPRLPQPHGNRSPTERPEPERGSCAPAPSRLPPMGRARRNAAPPRRGCPRPGGARQPQPPPQPLRAARGPSSFPEEIRRQRAAHAFAPNRPGGAAGKALGPPRPPPAPQPPVPTTAFPAALRSCQEWAPTRG